jgi:hypothetical protein
VAAVGITLALFLIALGVGTALRQRRTLRRLRGERFIPSDELGYLRGQVVRRLLTAAVLVLLGGLIGGAFVSGMEARATGIAERQARADANPGADPAPPPSDDDRQFVKLWGAYWIVILVLVFAAVCLAVFDFWGTRRYWMAQYRLMKADHEAKLQRDLAVYRQAKDNDRLHRLGGKKPDDKSGDDTDEHPPVE